MLGSLLAMAAVLLGGAAAQPDRVTDLVVDAQYTTVPVSEYRSGGPPPNGIPPLGFKADALGLPDTRPARFERVTASRRWLQPREPVILVTVNGETGIFPLQVLIWHEVANVTLGGVPVAVTFCPLCNTALVVDRRVPVKAEHAARLKDAGNVTNGRLLVTFGVSGLLYKSDLVMFDSATHSLWYQAIGRALTGTLAGTQLRVYPSFIVPFDEAAREAPAARVRSRNTGYTRDYGRNPSVGYDDANELPFLSSAPLDGRLMPKERVVTVSVGDTHAAYPFSVLARVGVVNDRVANLPLVVFWANGTTSALGAAQIGKARDVGAGVMFNRRLNGRSLTFRAVNGAFRDRETGSTWSLTGRATHGALKGAVLKPVTHANHFWFAWAAYVPPTRVYAPR